mmetsp:Transcript_9772/g.21773  ORF Transcript_9772/g.21773 Transcript_9772/m.21773 type:complete len:212 (+) Transcript_9772:236-871(+)
MGFDSFGGAPQVKKFSNACTSSAAFSNSCGAASTISSTNLSAADPSFRKGKRGMFGLMTRTTITPGTLSTRTSTKLLLTRNCASPPVNDLIAPLTSSGGVTVTVSLSERSSRIGFNDLRDSTRYFDKASRLMMAFLVSAGTPLRSISMEVAVGDNDVVVAAFAGGTLACASGGDTSGGENSRDAAMKLDAAAVVNERAIDAIGISTLLCSS